MRIFARFLATRRKNNIQMNKIINNTAFAPLGTSGYESPTMTVVETVIEGLLCVSKVGSDLTVDPWEGDGDFDW